MSPTSIAGRYTVQRAVGHGGMGTVWLCRDEMLGRDVAVKQVGSLPGETTSDVNRALREARSSAALNHRNVVSVYDAVEDGGHNWLVMEYVPSRTLAEILAEDGRITPERAAAIGAQVADGLAAAHRRGTVHRDVKPSNILVTDDDHVKITDFGIARTHGDVMRTQTGLVIGTPSYLSPELARGEEPGLPSDVWALGATLYAAVEGHPLYPERANVISLIASIAAEVAPPPQRAGFLTGPINRMLDRDRDTRWSMDDVAKSLAALHRRHPVAPPPQATTTLTTVPLHELLEPDPTPTRERPRVVPAPVLVPAPVPAPVHVPAAVPDPRRRLAWILPFAALLLVLVGLGSYALVRQLDGGSDPSATSDGGGPRPVDRTPTSPVQSSSASESTSEPTPEPTTEPTTEPTPESATAPVEQTPATAVTATTPASNSSDVAAFALGYYGLLPDDTKSAYDLLSADYRSGTSYGSYRGFWRTIASVSATGAVAYGAGTVDVSLTYTGVDGRTQSETRRLYLEQGEGGYRITGDEAVAG